MRYFLIVGEASGDLHASHLMRALQECDTAAEFRYYGGDAMKSVAPGLLCHYKHLAYMGFIPVLMHLPTILRGMQQCKKAIASFRPDMVILVDYPGFNLKIAKYVHQHLSCPVYYYISPKIWAWKEHRIKEIRQNVDKMFSILPFEVDFYKRHDYPIAYVGNPTLDEVTHFLSHRQQSIPDNHLIALLPGSRNQEINDNFSRMLIAVKPFLNKGFRVEVAVAPSQSDDMYRSIIRRCGLADADVTLVHDSTFELLSRASTACVTSGTAALETALFRVPQVVCYYIVCGRLINLLRRLFLHVPYISLVNLICGKEVVPELVANEMTSERLRSELEKILPGGDARQEMLDGYEQLYQLMGPPGAPKRVAEMMISDLNSRR